MSTASTIKSLAAYDLIRDMILSGEALPGTRLVLVDLEKKLGVGRGPIRDALMRLDKSGLVQNIPYKGAIVMMPPSSKEIEHIFDELYHVDPRIQKGYFRIKVLELLLYLDALELAGRTEERPYFYKSQVEKVKAIQALLTQDPTKKYTLEELSAQFDIALTPMKTCFKSVYGSPIFTYMRNYRMNVAASLLRSDKSLKVAEIAGLVGYDSPSKFAAAFHQVMGKTPLEYRKSMN